MNSSAIIAAELVFVLGAALTWGCWELYSLRREKKRMGEQEKPRPDADADSAPP